MLIKPYIERKEVRLPIEQRSKPAYFGTEKENLESLENNGQLLMLTTMYSELSIKNNKSIHDKHNPFDCNHSWSICKCYYAKTIRVKDLMLQVNDVLMEVI